MTAQLGVDDNIEILARARIMDVDQEADGFRVRIRTRPRYVIPERCIGCGTCEEVCPKSVTNLTPFHDKPRKAIYLPSPHGIPPGYVIDEGSCIFFNNQVCGLCQEACPRQAIDLGQEASEFEIRVQAAILTPGAEPLNPTNLGNFGYGRYPDVITTLDMELMLSPTGPTRGELLRPSDGSPPRKIAWIQCVGARDKGHPYCSSICCMAAVKQALSLRQSGPAPPETHIFHNDIMAHQKWAERYLQRALEEGVKLRQGLVHLLWEEGKQGALMLRTWNRDKGAVEERFDMVVLSVGLAPGARVQRLFQQFGIEADRYGFATPYGFLVSKTSRQRVFAAGTCLDPKSIQGSVIEASAAACLLAEDLGISADQCRAQAKGRGLPERKGSEKGADIPLSPPKIGVFVCKCGRNIDSILDISHLVEHTKGLEHVVTAEAVRFACAPDALRHIADAIAQQGLNRIVIAACSPKSHEQLFRQALVQAGLNGHLLEIANIREQAAWAHEDEPEEAQRRALDQIKMAVSKAALLRPFNLPEFPVKRRALVVGGGIAGMSAASALSRRGIRVTLVERQGELGGNARMLIKSWRGLEIDGLLSRLRQRVTSDKSIELLMNSEVEKSTGETGNFVSFIRNLEDNSVRAVNHGAVILATGAKEARPKRYFYGDHPAILTHQDLDRKIMAQGVEGVLGGGKSVVFIQCVGSCSDERPYCSRVCCTHSITRALMLKEHAPGTEIYILHRHMRTYGKREMITSKARAEGIKMVRFDSNGQPELKLLTLLDRHGRPRAQIEIELQDDRSGERLVLRPDLVVLASAIEPDMDNNRELSKIFKVPLGPDGFFQESHTKLRPAELKRDGFFVAGLAHYPKEVEESISQAVAAAGKAAAFLGQESVVPDRVTAELLPEMCDGCALCLDVCDEKAIGLVEYFREGEIKKIVEIDGSLCSGCGACEGACPQYAIGIPGYMPDAIMKQIEVLTQYAT